ncbi:plasma kallikrein-like [Ixodes scapularis]|uniref:plasma kallikrein-like n=1 Tax=Ixodes scapularis TaxID=6945 RepID=UPI001A9FE5F0|nr:plasma kallikrein-like [Ixodes scapularis]
MKVALALTFYTLEFLKTWAWPEENCGQSVPSGGHIGRILARQSRPARSGEHPWTVSIQMVNQTRHICSGSLITAEVVLTAAHCLEDQLPRKFKVIAGFTNKMESSPFIQKRFVLNYYLHERFIDDIEHDLAIIKLKKPFSLYRSNGHIAPVCLARQGERVLNNVDVVAWKMESEDESSGRFLRTITLPIRKGSRCRSDVYYHNDRTTFCAGPKRGGKCVEDSGGPAVQEDYFKVTQVGILSYGKICHSQLGFFVRLSNYIDWIEEKLNTIKS